MATPSPAAAAPEERRATPVPAATYDAADERTGLGETPRDGGRRGPRGGAGAGSRSDG